MFSKQVSHSFEDSSPSQPIPQPQSQPQTKPQVFFQGRKLPDNLISFNSPDGKELFKESLNQGYAEGYFNLSSCFSHQMDPAYCGLSSLSIVLNALQVKGAPVWKGPWRWWSDELLNCCSPIEEVKKNGTTFSQFACLAKCHCDVVVKRADHVTKEEFIEDLKKVCSSSDVFMVISFSRKTLQQTGDGHYSPIGAYNSEKNMALVLDVARFKYPSYFASVDKLFEAMQPLDEVTNLPRGYFLLSSNPYNKTISLCKLSHQESDDQLVVSWTTLGKTFCQDIPKQLQSENPKTLEDVAKIILSNQSLVSFVSMFDVKKYIIPPGDENEEVVVEGGKGENEENKKEGSNEYYLSMLLNDLAKSPLYPIVESIYQKTKVYQSESNDQIDSKVAFAILFLLSSPPMMFSRLELELVKQIERFQDQSNMSAMLKREVTKLNEEIKDLVLNFCNCATSPGACNACS
ncbi:hypothetical protein Glove_688g28 [Diversispora epigaea]|uniref:glutathione gamma-glutamylcysteinyltransferase n=1 Tax=Diversispora epigaea TaxID=1348612 RepID=A0A397G2C0_9GLOM|nr:hypothetical protein Glove_688g28 [Diversispora epigaea]